MFADSAALDYNLRACMMCGSRRRVVCCLSDKFLVFFVFQNLLFCSSVVLPPGTTPAGHEAKPWQRAP